MGHWIVKISALLKNMSVLVGARKFDLAGFTWPPVEKLMPGFAALMTGFLAASLTGFAVAYLFMPSVTVGTGQSGARLSDASSQAPVPPPPGPGMMGEKLAPSDFKTIISRNVFDSEGGEVDTSKDGEAKCLPVKSELPLKFTGVIYGGTAQTSLVLLESTASKQADTFLLGDLVPGEAKIVDIQRDKVFFERAGCPEFLELLVQEPPKRRVAGERKRSVSPNVSAGAGIDSSFREDGFERVNNNTAVTKQWVEKALTVDFAKTLQDAKASPNTIGNEVKGFVLTRIRPDSVYEKMGFQDGDIVEGINGIELNDAARAIQTLNAMRNEANMEVQVKRGGQTLNFKLQVK